MTGRHLSSIPVRHLLSSLTPAICWRFVCGRPKRVRHLDAFESRAEGAGSDTNFGFLPTKFPICSARERIGIVFGPATFRTAGGDFARVIARIM